MVHLSALGKWLRLSDPLLSSSVDWRETTCLGCSEDHMRQRLKVFKDVRMSESVTRSVVSDCFCPRGL